MTPAYRQYREAGRGMGSGKYIVLIGLIAGGLIPTTTSAKDEGWTPNPEQIARLERGLVLPDGAHPLTDYARYYWGTTVNGVPMIQGQLIWGDEIRRGVLLADKKADHIVHIVKGPVLTPTDMGCNLVYVSFDLQQKKATAMCDGVA
jgi:hypothetical protein